MNIDNDDEEIIVVLGEAMIGARIPFFICLVSELIYIGLNGLKKEVEI